MRNIWAAILIFALLGSFCGCTKSEPEMQSPVTFYYRRSHILYEGIHGVVAPEIQEANSSKNDVNALLEQYFQGPISADMHTTFPGGTKLLSITIQNELAHVLVTSHFSNLKGMDLTIACACITMTVMELTGVEAVEIKADRVLLNDAESIIMDRETLLLLDDTVVVPAE